MKSAYSSLPLMRLLGHHKLKQSHKSVGLSSEGQLLVCLIYLIAKLRWFHNEDTCCLHLEGATVQPSCIHVVFICYE